MKKFASSSRKKISLIRLIGMAAVFSMSAVFINAQSIENVRAVSKGSSTELAYPLVNADGSSPADLSNRAAVFNSASPDSPSAVNNYATGQATGITYNSIVGGAGTNAPASFRNALSTDDNLTNALPIGFTFIYNGQAFQSFRMSTNGFLTFNTTSTAIGSGNGSAYSYTNPNFTSSAACTCNTLAVFYDDLQTAGNAGTLADLQNSLKYQTSGTAGNRVLTAEWVNFQDFATSSTASLNFQVKLYESDGHIEFVYGTMNPGAAAWTYTLGINAATVSAVPTAAELLTQQTENSNTFSETPQNGLVTVPTTNSIVSFTPPVTAPTAPTGLTFTGITRNSVTLNWTDNAGNELNYNILISTDGGATYQTFGAILPPDSNTITITGLAAGTTYFFRVIATSEGYASTPLDGSVTTTPPTSGTKTVGPGGDFATLTDAINDVNPGTGAGGVTYNVLAGTTFSETTPCITVQGTAASPIIFQKSGAGANPIVQPPGSASTQDTGLCIVGGDYITFDGVDVVGNATVEFGYLIANGSATNGASNNTIQNSKITLNRTNTASVGISASLATATATAASGANSNNRYYNITIENAYRGINLVSSSATFPDTNNEIGTTAGGTTTIGAATANDIGNGAVATAGIRAANQSGLKIFNTEVRNVTVTGAVLSDGILIETFIGTNSIFNNKVHDIRNTSTSATTGVTGIRATHTTTGTNIGRIYNNFVYGITSGYTGTATATRQLKGIFAAGTGGSTTQEYNVDFNSVRIDGSGSPNISSANFEIATTSGPINRVRNNIFANVTGTQAGVAKHYTWVTTSATSIGNTGSVSNFNDLYVTGTNGFVGLTNTTDRATLAAWRTAFTPNQDLNSISVDPLFVSATDLHVSSASPVVNAGTTISYTNKDIDGQNRVGVPDIGADEPDGVTPPANDIAAVAITNPPASSVFLTGTTITPTATFTNIGGATQTNVAVQFTISGPGGYSYTNTQTIASIAPDQTVTVTFATTPAFTTAGTYTMAATVTTPDAIPGNDTQTGSFQVIAPFNGSTNVGTGETYTSLTNTGGLFAALNTAGVSGNVIINITSDLTTETGTVALNQMAGSFSITIKPSGAARIISGSAGSALIKLNGADNVTIDGSLAGGTDRSLTITNTNNATGTATIWNSSLGAGAGATGNRIINTNISAGADQSASSSVTFGVISSGSTIAITSDGLDNDNLTVANNAFTRVSYGVFIRGAAANTNGGNIIRQNLIGPAAFGVDQLGKAGIVVQHQDQISIVQNEVRFVGRVGAASTGNSGDKTGIGLGDVSYTPTSTIITNSSVSRNLVHDIVEEQTFGANGILIAGANGALATSNTIANNMIYNVRGNGTSGDQTAGLAIGTGNGDSVVFNSVYLTGDIDPGTTTTATGSSAGIIIAATPTNLTLKNNISYMDVSSNTGTLRHYAFIKPSSTYSFGTGGSDNNDYYVLAANTQSVLFGNGTSATSVTSVTTLAAFQAETPAHDQNSKDFDPLFASATNLHLQAGSTLVGLGTPVSVVSDYDNDLRDNTPDIGADEIINAPRTGAIPAGTYGNANLGTSTLGGNVTFTGTVTLNGIVTPGANTLTFDCGATAANAGSSNYVDGSVTKNYCGGETFSYPVGTVGGPNDGYSPATATITAVGVNPSSLAIDAVDAILPGLEPTNAVTRHWLLTETGDLTANPLTFTYLPGDVPAGANPAIFRVYRNDGTLTSFCSTPCVSGTTATTNIPVTAFSPWGVGALVPTAASVDVGGRIREANGRGISRARVTMSNSQGEVRMAYTNQFGYFRFGGVPAGDNYIFSATHIRYQFAQPTLVRFISEETDNINFTASGENPDFNAEATFFDNAPFDFDGDGRTDVSVYRNSNNTWYIKRSSDNTLFAQAFGAAGDRLAPADFDGDGKTDLAVFRPSEGNWYIWMSASNSLLTENFGTAADRPIAADFDGDRKADISVWNEMRGVWQVKLSTNGTIVSEKFVNGKGNFTPLASDRNGDGKADFVFFNNLNATWTIRTSAGVNIKEQFGAAGDRAAMGDFDGDAKGDLAVYRASENAWTIKLANGSELTDLRISANADNAVVGDFDGDGKYDAAGYGGGVWSVLQSVNNMVRQQQFGLADDQVIPAVR